MIDPFDDVMLLEYFHDVCLWHGFVKFLGLPHLQENPDQPLHELYVEPFLSDRPIHPDEPPDTWLSKVEPALKTVKASQRLVVLGDPGSGKSTLVSWIAWQLSQPQKNPWQTQFGPLVPLPMVLRELKIDASMTWERLLDAFLAHSVAAKLDRAKVDDLLRRGQAFVLLDGVDEIGSLEVRRSLQGVFLEAVTTLDEGNHFLVTSRLVGYDEVPFHRMNIPREEFLKRVNTSVEQAVSLGLPDELDAQFASLVHVAPFSDDQIDHFAQNWYNRREAAPALRGTGAGELVRAIHGSESTLRLARNPNLLTLMALIHRVQRRLPHGRALLFEKIAEAYLDSIDAFRGLQEVDYPLAQKKRWLAYVAFRMQLRRSEALKKKHQESQPQREVLADRATVVAWIFEAMEASAHGADRNAAEKFIDYIGRRSGLLLPRGEGLFAFTHLSFQEYFTAWYLAQQVMSPRWLKGRNPEGTRPEDLHRYANESVWREPLVLLFELLAEQPGWAEELSDLLFGENFGEVEESPGDRSQEPRAELVAELAIDLYSGLSEKQRREAWAVCWRWEIEAQQVEEQLYGIHSGIARRLISAERQDSEAVWRAFGKVASIVAPKRLTLRGTPLADLSPVSGLSSLERLDLTRTSVSDLSPLAGLLTLKALYLHGTFVSDLSPLSGLSSLERLDLDDTFVSDLSPLFGLSNLESLYCARTPVNKADLIALQKALPNTRIFT